jgi:hypothetical protein
MRVADAERQAVGSRLSSLKDQRVPAGDLVHPDGGSNSLGVMSCRRVFPFMAHRNRVATFGEVY